MNYKQKLDQFPAIKTIPRYLQEQDCKQQDSPDNYSITCNQQDPLAIKRINCKQQNSTATYMIHYNQQHPPAIFQIASNKQDPLPDQSSQKDYDSAYGRLSVYPTFVDITKK